MIPSVTKENVICSVLVGIAAWYPAYAICRADDASVDRPRDNAAAQEHPACQLLADRRLESPLRAIVKEYSRRTGIDVSLAFLPADQIQSLIKQGKMNCDVVACMTKKGEQTPIDALKSVTTIAWKYPTGEPVRAAVVGRNRKAAELLKFLGGPTGHLIWSDSEAGFTIVGGMTHAEAIDWVAKNRVQHTYPMTAARMLSECGGIRDGVCIDIGCGTGALDVELAKRTNWTITGLDIDADMKPLFDKRVAEAGFQDRIRFVAGDAQSMPFPDDYADIIVSRGTLTFIPDIGKCLKEVDRVLKPTGVAFLGGRYLYTPHEDKISTEKLKQIVASTHIAGASVIDARGQWVKIVGPDAPAAVRTARPGPHMLANRFIADYAITKGRCLLFCMNDSPMIQELQQGFVDATDLRITAAYPSAEAAEKAEHRMTRSGLGSRITCVVATLDQLPFEADSFDLIAGIGPILIWGEREKKMRSIYRLLRQGGVALIGGRYLGMPDFRKVSSETLRASAANTGISSIRVIDDMGQWVEIRKGIKSHGPRD